MAHELKTRKNDTSVDEFIAAVEPDQKRADSQTLLGLMRAVTGEEGSMWGSGIVGFGKYSYTYASGHSGEWFATGFAPRKQNLTLYIVDGFERYEELLGRLGKHKVGKSCLYINRLADVDMDVLRELVRESVASVQGDSLD